ncbi:hypothetical protein LSH36_44g06061 [Paralvinella palmiformis]|uniref:Myosin motor domain-containing protein n=1 Tax=Paralvinella palmiformis TaxID=53620 RepID=A0AAD9K6R6_9ANNE|nr:hypothetical protein LSH36_44g06061 [Paralvinella palmiformis]
MPFSDFRHRFEILAPPDSKPTSAGVDDKQAVDHLLDVLEIEKSTYRLGLSQVFFRTGCLAQLEDAREEKIAGTVIGLQSLCRGHLARQRLNRLKLQHLAVSCIQRNVRKFMAIRNWSWWRLYTKIQPLLDVHRTEDELRNKDIELDQLKMKFEKTERERNEFKQAVDKLESKLSEMTADLSEEHTTSSQASEMLERETGDRIRFERELQEIQTKYSTLQRVHEQTEMDLMHTRMLAASLDGELEDDEEGGDSVYRDHYLRLKREMEFMKKKLQQEHEEELEQKEKSKKALERKVTDARAETEEHQRQVGNFKRKCQRLTQDVGDMKLHLQEQMMRNAELEKKQRKFDTELHKVNEMLKSEKQLKDKAVRERDELSADKFTMEQELKNMKLDYDLQSDKAEHLTKELDDLTSVSQDSQELLQLKRQKNELERRVLDQEEELDEQAATIQQLEQVSDVYF